MISQLTHSPLPYELKGMSVAVVGLPFESNQTVENRSSTPHSHQRGPRRRGRRRRRRRRHWQRNVIQI